MRDKVAACVKRYDVKTIVKQAAYGLVYQKMLFISSRMWKSLNLHVKQIT